MERINVTKTFLPPIEEYEEYLSRIWNSVYLTNQGPLLHEFEAGLGEYLGLENVQLVSNGTVALQLALNALDITEGEIITTPFSFVATTSSILWERCKPVFVDIEPDTFCIDAEKIEAAITPRTKAIMPVHVFGFACDVEKIEAIADRHGLKVIYDGAHAFGAKYKGRSLLGYGDVTTCSFHATKLFHTIEGGAVIAHDKSIAEKIDLTKKFGYVGDEHIRLGINAKASEFQAAMGLCNLKYVSGLIADRKTLFEQYNELLNDEFQKPVIRENSEHNYGYYPLVFKTEGSLLKAVEALAKENIYPRRYFYPSLNELPYVNGAEPCPNSERIAKTILCLPLYAGLDSTIVEKIAGILNSLDA